MNHNDVRELCAKVGIEAMEPQALTPTEKPDYAFREDQVRELIAFWLSEEPSMKLVGPAGCGKTSIVEQFHAALGYPLLMPNTNSRTEAEDLLGKVTAGVNGWGYVPGPMQDAAENGVSIFIDEYNVMSSGAITSLNRAAEGGSIDIPETGGRIVFQPGFRLFAACNPNDKALGFFGRNSEDASNLERFWTAQFSYPDPAQEIPIVQAQLEKVFDPTMAEKFAKSMVEVAGRIRTQYMGVSEDAGALEITMSTRSLKRWAVATATFATLMGPNSTGNAFVMGVERALTNAASPETKKAIEEIVIDVFR